MLVYEIKSIDDFSDKELRKTYSCMCDSRKAQVKGFEENNSKRNTLAGEYLARKLLSEKSGIPPEYFLISPDLKGKLQVENYDGLYFNISHSGSLVCAAACSEEVGIDIEIIRPISLKFTKRICNENELRYIFGKFPSDEDFEKECDTDTLIRFYQLWTAKEAYLKCTGEGIKGLKNIKSVNTDFQKLTITEKDYVLQIVKKSDIL